MLYSQDDTSLILQAGQGDRQAFGEIVEIHHRAIFRFIQRFLGMADAATAEDLAQDVFLAAWNAAPSFTPQASVQTWLLRITTNKCLNHQRARRRKPTIPLSAEAEPASTHAGSEPAAPVRHAELSAELQQAIAALKPKQRAAVILRYAHDLSHAEIAAVLGIGAPAIKSLLFRAHSELRKRIKIKEI